MLIFLDQEFESLVTIFKGRDSLGPTTGVLRWLQPQGQIFIQV